jgi:hypothetical protein
MLEEYEENIDTTVRCSKSLKTASEYALANSHDATLQLLKRWEVGKENQIDDTS